MKNTYIVGQKRTAFVQRQKSYDTLQRTTSQSKIIYALPAFAGQLTAMDITRVDALVRKAKRRGLAKTIPSMLEIIEDHDESLFKRMRDPSHCLHHLLLPVRPNALGRLRSRGHPYTLPQINFKQHKLSFPTRCLFNNM